MNYSEKYRPTSWAEVVGQDAAVEQLQALAADSWGGRALWIQGPSGTGKDTLAGIYVRLRCEDWNIETHHADTLTAAKVREINESLRYAGMTGGDTTKNGRAVIVPEAHGIPAHGIRALKTSLEEIPEHAVWVFTTTGKESGKLFDSGEDAMPVITRCDQIDLSASADTCRAFGQRAYQLAQADGRDGHDAEVYRIAAHVLKGSMRALLQAVGSGKVASIVRKHATERIAELDANEDATKIAQWEQILQLCS